MIELVWQIHSSLSPSFDLFVRVERSKEGDRDGGNRDFQLPALGCDPLSCALF
jgi:hypothetical protein